MIPKAARGELRCLVGKISSHLPWKILRSANNESVFPLFAIYETVRNGGLPRLHRFTCEMLHNSSEGYISRQPESILADECTDEMSFTQAFDKLGVLFSIVEVADPTELPENTACPCQCWIYRHRHSYCA